MPQTKTIAAAAAVAAGWEAQILEQLEQRDQRVATMARVINSYSRLAGKVGDFANHSREMEARTRELSGEHERMMMERHTHGNGGGNSLAQRRIADLEREIEAMKEERTELYRTQGTNAQRLLDLSDKMRENDERVRQQELEITDLHETLRQTGSKTKDMRASLKEKDGTIQILQDEMSALQLEIVQLEERCGRLQSENDDLVKRWLKKMNDEADKVNSVTAELEQIKRKSAVLSPRSPTTAVFDDDFFVPGGGSTAPRAAVGKVDARMEEVHSIALSSNGEVLAAGGQSTTVRVFDAQTGDSIYSLTGCLKGVNHVDISNDGSMLVAASSDHTARIWKLDTGRHWKSLSGHIGSVVTARFNADASRVFTYSQDRTVKIWDVHRGLCIKTLFTVSGCHDIALLTSDGSRIVTAHMDNSIRVWNTHSGKKLAEASVHKEQVMSVYPSRITSRILTNSTDGTLKLVDASTLAVLSVMSAPGYRPSRNWAHASLSPDDRYAAAGSIDGKLYIWDTATSDLVRTLDVQKSAICTVMWDHTGLRMYSAEKSRYVMILQ